MATTQPAPRDPATVSAVSLDLDDTLWDITPVIVAAERELRSWLKRHCPRVVDRYSPHATLALRERFVGEHPDLAHDLGWLRTRILEHMIEDCGYPIGRAGEAFEVFFAARNRVALHADVLPALESLHRRYTLVALTNGNADLERVGLSRYFDHYVAARDVGAAKPDQRMFAAVESATGRAAAEILHVGDDPLCDVVGASRAGMHTAWVNRSAASWPGDHPPPDLHVPDMLALARRLLRAA